MKNNMEKYDLNEGNEALNRVLLMMKYDSKKTLTENKGIILENTNCENSISASDAIKKIKEVSEIFQTLEGFITQEWVDDDTEAKELYDIVSEIVGHNVYDELNDTCEEGVKFLKKTFKSTQLSKSWTITWLQETDIIVILNNLIKGFFKDKADIRRYLEATKRIIENPKKIKKTDDGKKTGGDTVKPPVVKPPVVKPPVQSRYRTNCKGTYTKWCKSPVVAEVQRCLGLVPDGKFGPKTDAALKAKGFDIGFTDNDVKRICNTNVIPPKEEQPPVKISDEDTLLDNQGDASATNGL